MFLEYGVAASARGSSAAGNNFADIVMANQTTFLVVAGLVLVLALYLLRAR